VGLGCGSPLPPFPSMPRTQRIGSAPPEVRSTPLRQFARPSPVTPTPGQNRGGSLMRSPMSALEFGLKQSSREDEIFQNFKPALRKAKSLVSFEWDNENRIGTLVPIP